MDKGGYNEKRQKAFEIDFEKNIKMSKRRSLDYFKCEENEEENVATIGMMVWEGELVWPGSKIDF